MTRCGHLLYIADEANEMLPRRMYDAYNRMFFSLSCSVRDPLAVNVIFHLEPIFNYLFNSIEETDLSMHNLSLLGCPWYLVTGL